jgi:hypothetical protein
VPAWLTAQGALGLCGAHAGAMHGCCAHIQSRGLLERSPPHCCIQGPLIPTVVSLESGHECAA